MLRPAAPAVRTHKAQHLALLQDAHALLITRAPVPGIKPAPGQPGAASDYVPSTPDIFVAVLADGRVLAFNGHVDLGTGIGTSLAQIVAEELDVALDRVQMVLGHTEAAPNQGPTIASATIQISAVPLRKAAAQARAWFVARAVQTLGVDADALRVDDGLIGPIDAAGNAKCAAVNDRSPGGAPDVAEDDGPSGSLCIDYWTLLAQGGAVLSLADAVVLKDVAQYRVVGRSAPRVDIPAKATGGLTYVHDVRVAGMLHGRVVRPPYPGRDTGDFIGRSLLAIDESSVAGLPGIVRVVRQGDFVGVVAEREEQAIRAARQLKVQWAPIPAAPDLSDVARALRTAPSTLRPLIEQGDVDAALATDGELVREYVWPYQMHASIGPSCAVADWRDDGLTVWAGTQNPHMLRIDLHRLLGLGEDRIEIIRLEAAGCYGRNCADDVCADAALLSQAVGAPVRVQLSREQEHAWEPKGTAQLMTVRGAVDGDGQLSAYEFATRYPSNDAPMLALLLTGKVPADPRTLQMGDRTAVPPYRYASMRVACHDMPAIVRSSWLRGVSALPNSFAHDCFVDELAERAGQDRLAFRLRHLDDTRAVDLLRAVAERAGWRAEAAGSRGRSDADGLLRGRGIAYARYIHSRFPGFGAAWSAWVVDLSVDPGTGRIAVDRIVVGQDTGMMVNPDGVRHQIHGNVIQSLSRALKESVRFDDRGVASLEWGAYPILGFKDIPAIDVVLMPRQDEPPMGAGESASVPGAAAIANALFDATGRRFRAPPFTPERVLQGLRAPALPGAA